MASENAYNVGTHRLKYQLAAIGVWAEGDTVPADGATGYPKGMQFVKTDGGVGTTLYVNEGDEDTADFNAVT